MRATPTLLLATHRNIFRKVASFNECSSPSLAMDGRVNANPRFRRNGRRTRCTTPILGRRSCHPYPVNRSLHASAQECGNPLLPSWISPYLFAETQGCRISSQRCRWGQVAFASAWLPADHGYHIVIAYPASVWTRHLLLKSSVHAGINAALWELPTHVAWSQFVHP